MGTGLLDWSISQQGGQVCGEDLFLLDPCVQKQKALSSVAGNVL